MIRKNELLLYNLSTYQQIKSYFSEQQKEITSITEISLNELRIYDLAGNNSVIDISALTSVTQYHSEKLISLFDHTFTFIADIKYKDFFEKELRFCFDEFNVFDNYVEEDDDNSLDEKKYLEKKHKKIINLELNELELFFKNFEHSLYGHQKFKDDFRQEVENFLVFNRLEEHKILSIFLMGDSGVGKTEVARAIHRALGGQNRMAKINFGNYSSDNSLNSLIGSPRGYIGSEDGEIFIRVDESDTGIILIDEFEKSNTTLFNYFLDVLENGKMVSSLAHEIDLNGFIIIFTSNISKENFKDVISPELSSRLDYKGYFSILKTEDKEKYVEFRVKSIVRKYNKNVENVLTDDFIIEIISQINVVKFKNMRDLNKAIKQTFVNKIKNLVTKRLSIQAKHTP